MTKAFIASAKIITFRLFHLSIRVPAKGPMKTPGSNDIIDANAKTDAEPDSLVSHQTRENWTSRLPNKEKACAEKMTQNFFIDGFSETDVCVESPEDSINSCVGFFTFKGNSPDILTNCNHKALTMRARGVSEGGVAFEAFDEVLDVGYLK